MTNLKYKVLALLFVISLASSLALSFLPSDELCTIQNGCQVVHYSSYNYTFGIQNSYYGIVIFFFLSVLIINYLIKPANGKKALINLSIIIGSLVSLYFMYLQIFVLNAFCRYCLVIDISVIIALILIFPDLKRGFESLNSKN